MLGASLSISRGDLVVNIPLTIFDGDEEVIFTIKKRKDIDKALSSIFYFNLEQGSKKIQEFADGIELSFEVDKKRVKNPDKVKVFYWNAEDNSWELIGGNYNNGVVTATVQHFSIYSVFELSEDELNAETDEVTPKPQEGQKLPDTATSIYNWLIAGIVLMLAGITAIVIQRRLVIKRNE